MLAVLSISFVVLILLSVPVAFSMLLSGIFSLIVIGNVPFSLITQKLFYGMDSSSLLAVPLFIIAGELMNSGGITKRLMDFAMVIVGHIKGGLCHVAVVAAMIFAGVSGSSIADAAAISSVSVPMMRKEGYDDDVAVSICAAAGTIGPVIPPSIPLVIYSSITSLSIGKLFAAGFIPGILTGIALMIVAYIYAIKRNYPKRDRATFKTVYRTTIKAFFALMAPIIVLGGIIAGIFSATEAGAIACLYCFIVSIGYGDMSRKKLTQTLISAGETTAAIMIIIASATIFQWILSFGNFPIMIGNALLGLTNNPNIIVLLVIGLMLFLGCFVETTSLMIILVPVFYPVLESLGYDGIQFGIVFLLTMCVGALTPPVGTVFYTVLKTTGAKIEDVGLTVWIFCCGILLVCILVALIPPLSLWLPSLIM